jgi:hypothetical protein
VSAARAQVADAATARLHEHPLLLAQRSLGNRLVSQVLQARLRVSQPGDPLEREADRVADRIVSVPEPGAAPRAQAAGLALPSTGAGTALDPGTRADMERRFGVDLGQVRVHTDARAAEAARSIGARAYTVGRDIVFGAGRYVPATPAGRTLLAHELAHVVQHDQGRSPGVLLRAADAGGGAAPRTYDARFIQSDDEFFSDLIMAIANFGRKGRMDGQTPAYKDWASAADWVDADRGGLKSELLAWKGNANGIVTDNHLTFVESVITSVGKEIFGTLPGPSLTTTIAVELVQIALFSALEHVWRWAPLADAVVGIVKEMVFHAMLEEDMKARAERFSSALRDSTALRAAIVDDAYNLDTLFSYYQTWLDLCTTSELSRFRIPFSPRSLDRTALTSTLTGSLRDAKSGVLRRRTAATLDRVGLFHLLTTNGLIADTPDVDRALVGLPGLSTIRKPSEFPVRRFVSPGVPPGDGPFLGDRVLVYVLPKARELGMIAPGVVPELGHRPGIVLLFERTASHASYDLEARTWVT